MAKPSLAIEVNGMKFKNPFVLGSGPPGTNGKVIARAFERGWGGVVCKTISMDNSKVTNVAPRYGKLRRPWVPISAGPWVPTSLQKSRETQL